jgi:hypothetical protein
MGKRLAKYSAIEMIERVGNDAIKEVVASVLCGGNIRSLTEGLTRKRLSLSNAALFFTYLQASKKIEGFRENMSNIVSDELRHSKLSTEEKLYLEWMLGLTKKSIQNVMRGEEETTKQYLLDLEKSLLNSSTQLTKTFGNLEGIINIGKDFFWVNWKSLLQIFTAIGTQTLALRGSEKSMYGKLFEKLILGSLLTILGFEHIEESNTDKMKKVFWLSSRGDKRESDATLLYKPGVGVRFDIGFIGPGNTEISLDKVSRFEREMEFGRKKHFMSTIVIIDRIGANSRIADMAKRINGRIVQMSMSQWITEICEILNDTIGFKHPLLKMSDEESLAYVKRGVAKIDLRKFIE